MPNTPRATEGVPEDVDTKGLLSPQELSDETGIPVSTLYVWRTRGEGPKGFRLGRHLRYRRSDVDEWIDGKAS